MLDYCCRFFLFFNQPFFLITLLMVGLIFINRKLFFQSAALFLVSIVINVALKVSFQIPLPESVAKNWFAFPSGHMQAATVLYGWFITRSSNRYLQIILVSLLACIGFSLIHFGYHNLTDVLGGVFFGASILLSHHYLQKNNKHSSLILLILTGLLLTYIHSQYSKIPFHAWQAAWSLCILLIGQKSFDKKYFLSPIKFIFFISTLFTFIVLLSKIYFLTSSTLINALLLLLIFTGSAFAWPIENQSLNKEHEAL